MTEVQKGMSLLPSEACKEANEGNIMLKESVSHMGNKFPNTVETSEQEYCNDVLELPITQSSVKIVYKHMQAR